MIEHIDSFIEILGLSGTHTEFNLDISFLGSVDDSERKGRVIGIKNRNAYKVFFIGLDKENKKKTIELLKEEVSS